jgi:NADPH:quinone reductase-like Zn-dependent oxidoreductase
MAKQMRAALYHQFGGADSVQVEMLDIPAVQEGEVLIRVKAAGVNPVDAFILGGHMQQFLPYTFPIVPGWDVAGVIEECGYSARRFSPGDEVYAYARRPTVHLGTFAEYIVLPESYVAARPKSLRWEEAAGIPLAGLTAYQSLFDAGHLQAGQSVLILGASGGVGSQAIQLAKAHGATVVAVASARNQEYMRELGADHTIDYAQGSIADAVKVIFPVGVDVLFDCISGDTLAQSVAALKPTGTLVSILSRGEGLTLGPEVQFNYVFVEPNSRQLDYLRELADAGKLKIQVGQTYSLEQVPEAFRQIETHHTTGKIVIVP